MQIASMAEEDPVSRDLSESELADIVDRHLPAESLRDEFITAFLAPMRLYGATLQPFDLAITQMGDRMAVEFTFRMRGERVLFYTVRTASFVTPEGKWIAIYVNAQDPSPEREETNRPLWRQVLSSFAPVTKPMPTPTAMPTPTPCIESTPSVGSVHLTYEVHQEVFPTDDQMEGLINTIRDRIDACGVQKAVVQRLGGNRIMVQLPAIYDVTMAKQLIGQTARLEFVERVCQDPSCTQFEDRPTGLTGEDLDNAFAGQDSVTGLNVVFFEMRQGATRTFAELTSRIFNTNNTASPDAISIFLDNELQVSARVRQPILTGTGLIPGNYTAEEARVLAIQLQSGALPVPIVLIEERFESE
ncbi:MAG: preprotein translocase subunit SecD [Dehalococcoidia bacterium]